MTSARNPTAQYYSGSLGAQMVGRSLRAAGWLGPELATALALRLFFTPLPLKWQARRQPLPPAWRAEPWPFEGSSITLYRRADAPTGRPRVLLLHGWGGHAGQLAAMADSVLAHGLEPLLIDGPAHGRSRGWRATLPQFSRVLFAVVARVGPLHGLVAHSMGALAAAHAVARGLPVQRLALLSPSVSPARVLHWFGDSFGLPAPITERMRCAIERREGAPLAEFETDWLAHRLPQPTLIVHDRDDRTAPFAAGRALATALRAARLLPTEGLGHRRILADVGVQLAVAEHVAGAPDALG